MVELVDTLDLGSSAARRGGSTPFSRTTIKLIEIDGLFLFDILYSINPDVEQPTHHLAALLKGPPELFWIAPLQPHH